MLQLRQRKNIKIAGYDGSTTTTWISGDGSGNLTFAGDVTVGDDLESNNRFNSYKFWCI